MPQHIYGTEFSSEIPLSGAIVIMVIHVKHWLCLMRSFVIFSGNNENPCRVPTDSLKSFELVSIKVKPIDLNTLTPYLKMSLHVLNR